MAPEGLTALGPFFAVEIHPPTEQAVPPWRPLSDLTGPSEPLRQRLAVIRATLASRGGMRVDEVELRVVASAMHLGIAARLTAPALGAAVLGCPIDLHPDRVWWQDVVGSPVPLSVPISQAGSSIRDGWDRRFVDEVLAPVTMAISALVSISGRVLRGNLASAVNAAAVGISRQRPDLADDAWQAARRLFAMPVLRGEQHPPGPAFRRSSCCLFYRLAPGRPASTCGDCILARP